MRRVLVPLDGTELAASILPDARRLAGDEGVLILMRDAVTPGHLGATLAGQRKAVKASRAYLDAVAQTLRAQGVKVRTQPLVVDDAAVAIDTVAENLAADMIAIATHGRSPAQRWVRGSVSWRAMLRSVVPVLIRHADEPVEAREEPAERCILVPLDGSKLAEKALPLAGRLAEEWGATLYIASVIDMPLLSGALSVDGIDEVKVTREHLSAIAEHLPGHVEARVLTGAVVDSLIWASAEWEITDIVMTSHGRTGLSRAIVGSVADELIHRLHLPIIVIPPLVTLAEDRTDSGLTLTAKI